MYILKKIKVNIIFDIKLIKGKKFFCIICQQIFFIYKVFAKIYAVKSFV